MSVSDIERGLVAGYILRVLRRGDLPLRATRHILGWLKERGDSLNFQMPKPLNKAIGNMYSPKFRVAELERTYGEHKPAIMAMLKKAAEETENSSAFDQKCQNAGESAGLCRPLPRALSR